MEMISAISGEVFVAKNSFIRFINSYNMSYIHLLKKTIMNAIETSEKKMSSNEAFTYVSITMCSYTFQRFPKFIGKKEVHTYKTLRYNIPI